MNTDTEKKSGERATAEKPGEATAANKEKITLSANGMASLLKSEFATDDAVPEKESPEGGKAGEANPKTDDAKEIPAPEEKAADAPADDTKTEAAAGKEAEAEPETKAAAEHPAEAGEDSELPEGLKGELEAWEATGGALPKGLQALVDKRIGKLTGARDAEKTRADQAEARLRIVEGEAAALRNDPKRPAHLTPNPVMDETMLGKLAATAKAFVAEGENYLDDTATDEERARVERFMASERLDAKGLKRRVRDTHDWLAQDLPEQRRNAAAFRQQEAATEPVVKAQMPWLDDQASPEYGTAQQVLSMMPELKARTPAHRVAVGTYVLGLKVMDHLAAAGVKTDAMKALGDALSKGWPITGKTPAPAAKKTAPPKTPAGNNAGGAAPRARAGQDEAARQEFNKAPTKQNVTELARQALMAA